ncbi:hypothetical protein MKD38_12985 [Cupriavidus sp. WGlv3]|uniref:hypothetical protein n=1 Tax=Cupriavidus sp. WGlv3 TaxID=2919924 RepID=UPI0020902D99|nr:hypothetical protein [Cupriavidus sp. WGlv3]MCO4862594.1 hypothetical protein [Cupriavidus sp. WGlv3]
MIEPIAAKPAAAVSTDAPAAAAASTSASASDAPGIRTRPAASTEIHISAPGHALAGNQAASVRDNSDVDDSGLPDQAKDAIKRLRELRAQLARKLQELEAAKNATTGTPDQKRIRIAVLQQEIASLGAAITTTTATLNQAIRELSAEQQMLAGSLAMR